ncbi:hypothetical protein FZEAL_3833 [Fusarium zealandicum]|uniref:Uncharacterized protein n=1 Tax=Fusarium zealandicum TaxID=1053134 RepID=A0A8H4UN05_9HYPO|nr:hypothetical protein FZEAL_3833 [Fusarium zealandicum]
MLGLRAGTLLNFIFGRQYAGIPQTDSASLIERAPVVITETVMESYTVVVPKTIIVEVTYHVPLNTSSSALSTTSALSVTSDLSATIDLSTTSALSATSDSSITSDLTTTSALSVTSSTLPFASTSISNSASVTTSDGPQDTPLFAINPSLLLSSESQGGDQIPTTTAAGDALLETSDANETTAPTETAAQSTSQETSTETATQSTSQEVPTETVDSTRLVDEQESTTSEVLLFDTASLTFSAPSFDLSTTLRTRPVTTTAASAPESTQSSDAPILNDSETGITDPRPSFTTATLPGGLVTTIGLDATAGNDRVSETESADVVSQQSSDTHTTPVVVGSVVGSCAALSMLVFLLWFLRRRAARRRRRSTLLTPLGIRPGAPGGGGGGEKYEIDNHSLGPTPRSTKLAAAVSVNAKKFGRRMQHSVSESSNVNMNRGNSQYLDAGSSHSRSASVRQYSTRANTPSEGQQGWWSRLILESSVEDVATQGMAEKEREQTRSPSPNPFSDANAMTAVPGNSPLSDANAMSRTSLVPSPLAPGRPQRPARPDDPFSDTNTVTPLGPAQQPPTTYAEHVQRSRGLPMNRNLTPQAPTSKGDLAPPSCGEQWRGNIHSNPFDLELDGRHIPSVSNIHPMPRYTAASSMYGMPKRGTTHSRAESFTSRYTSGVSMVEEWPRVPDRASRYSGAGYPPLRHSRSESDSVLGRHSVGQAV